MASRNNAPDGDRFRVRPSPPKSHAGPRPQRFISLVLKEVSKAGAKRSGKNLGRPANTFGRGRLAASMAGQRLGASARRVIIKSRFVVLRASPNSASVHLRYIERDGVTQDGQKGQAYGAETDEADLKSFQERGQGDRHQFRFIVSAEDALELEDLKGFTRQLMRRMEIDLETRLDWVAVDHWDTDNPHTHIVLNGHTGGPARDRVNLVIAPDYMANGMRLRASEIVTEWLGPRTEAEMRQSQLREVDHQRLTSLDRTLIRLSGANGIDLTDAQKNAFDRQRQNMLRARLQRLEGMRLARRVDANRWTLAPGLTAALTAMAERKDALDTMRRALKDQQRELVLDDTQTTSVIGRVAGKGLMDELNDRGYVVVDGIDGRAHYLRLPAGVDFSALPMNAIVEAKPTGQSKAVDRNILAASADGIYATASHVDRLARAGAVDPQETVEVHVRRLEALRRAGIVQRLGNGVWKIPGDLLEKAGQHDAQKAGDRVIELRSHLPIEKQVRALGATWLDRALVSADGALANQGFGAEVRDAMRSRTDFLVDLGLAERQGLRVVLARNLLATLRERELSAVGGDLAQQTGKTWHAPQDGQAASGVYRKSIQLISGRFALLDDGLSFTLVPWKPVIERRLGQRLSAVTRGSSVTWNLGRQRAVGI